MGLAGRALAQDPQPCNASVLCHPTYAAQAASVVRILTTNNNNGTGFLIRNPVPGGNPFVLTALHVVDPDDNGVLDPAELALIADPFTAGRFFIFFDYTSPCGAATIPGLLSAPNLVGALVRAYSADNDYVLLELRAPAPITANYANLKFPNSPQDGSFVIHHPRGTTKRIGFGNNGSFSSGGYFNVSMQDGRPAGGSSGGPLFDNDDRRAYAFMAQGSTDCRDGCGSVSEICNPYKFISLYDAWYGSVSSGGVSSLGFWLSGGGGGGGNPNDPPPPPPNEYAGGIPSLLTGPTVVCSIAKFELPNYPAGLPAGLTLHCELSSNLREVSRTANGIMVEPNFNAAQTGGPGFVTAAVTNAAVSPLALAISRSRLDVQVGTPANTPITITNQTNGTSFTTGQGGNLLICAGQQNILLASYGGPGGLTGGIGLWQFPADWGVSQGFGNSASVSPFAASSGSIVFFPGNSCGQSIIPAVIPATVSSFGGCGRSLSAVLELRVWPNPADNDLNIGLGPVEGGAARSAGDLPQFLRLFSALGQLVRESAWPSGQLRATLSVRGLPPGVYLLHATFAGHVEVRQVVVGQPAGGLSN